MKCVKLFSRTASVVRRARRTKKMDGPSTRPMVGPEVSSPTHHRAIPNRR